MQIIRTISEMQAFSRILRYEGKTLGFVPTMGALHEGHLSLVRMARDENDVTVVSVFVNPTQFGPGEDFKKYPRDLEGDRKKLESAGVDCLFYPSAKDMYPSGAAVSVSAGRLGTLLCGASRPGHFDGVVTVVTKLFNIVMPSKAYFGQKDFQQSVIIKRLTADLNIPVDIVVCPVVREHDGLAMSSRNLYLDDRQRAAATVLYRALEHARSLVSDEGVTDASRLVKEMEEIISAEPLARKDYVAVIDPDTLESVNSISGRAVACLAVFIGGTRLIDNMILEHD
jgi:pantoate--beta-alanine ligase